MKVIVIGLDGAGFDLLQPWIDDGKLPNLKKLIDNGYSAKLESCLPPVTAPNWKCYSTGKNPGRFGIFWWENIDITNQKINFPINQINKCKEIWDYIGEKGKSGIVNLPLTYPPKKVNGFMISGGSFADDNSYTYPKELEVILKKYFNYKVHPKKLNYEKKRIEEILELIESRFLVAKILLNEYDLDFLNLTIFYINNLHHFFWNGKYSEQAWKLIDKNIGLLLKEIKDEYIVFIISDHGSNKIEQIFYINNWLVKEGFLSLSYKYKLSNLIFLLGLNKNRLAKIIHKSNLAGLKNLNSKKIMNMLPSETGTLDQRQKTDKINWKKTKAVASGQGPIYLNLEEKIKKKARDQLVIKLENLYNPQTGKKIAKKVYLKEDIYSGEYVNKAPDLIIDQTPGTHIRGGIAVGKKDVFEKAIGWEAENKRDGIFIVCGTSISHGKAHKSFSILDVAPTILHLMNIPIPTDMDGRVLREIFEPGSKQGTRNIEYEENENITKNEKEMINRTLKKILIGAQK